MKRLMALMLAVLIILSTSLSVFAVGDFASDDVIIETATVVEEETQATEIQATEAESTMPPTEPTTTSEVNGLVKTQIEHVAVQ